MSYLATNVSELVQFVSDGKNCVGIDCAACSIKFKPDERDLAFFHAQWHLDNNGSRVWLETGPPLKTETNWNPHKDKIPVVVSIQTVESVLNNGSVEPPKIEEVAVDA